MARLARLVVPGELHLVVHRARQGATVFHDGADRRAWHDAVTAAVHAGEVALHGFGLLPGEARLLVTPQGADSLARFMQAIGRRHVRHHNDRYQVSGTPWEGRFRSCVVEAARYLDCLRWVEVDGAGGDIRSTEPDGSSAGHHLGSRPDPALVEHPAFWRLGNTPFEREAAWRARLDADPGPALAAEIRHCVLHGWVLGSAAFAERLAAESARPTRPRPRGRPPGRRAG